MNGITFCGVGALGVLTLLLTSACVQTSQTSPAPKQTYTAWKKQHPNVDAEIAELKKQTAALMAASRAQRPGASAVTEPPLSWRVPGALTELTDCADCPHMTIVPAGEFTMGSPAGESGRNSSELQRRVTIAYPLAISTWPVTRGDYAKFVAATQHPSHPNGCFVARDGRFAETKGMDWANPGFEQTDDHPLVCVSAADGQAYAAWLSAKTGHKYRLLSEAEYEYATRAGTSTAYWWGNEVGLGKAKCRGCNGEPRPAMMGPPPGAMPPGGGPPPEGAPSIVPPSGPPTPPAEPADTSGAPQFIGSTVPVGAYAPNPFGLYDMNGNAASWVEDCYHEDYSRAPTDGSPVTNGDRPCAQHAMRGGSWFNSPQQSRASAHFRIMSPNPAHNHLGFRIAREL